MLEISNLSFSYGDRTVLNSVSFLVKRGEKVALVGPSGSGKTTLFHLIAGLLKANSGHVAVGEPLTYMMQDDLLLPWRTVLDNVLLVAELAGEKPKDKALKILADVGLGGWERQYPKHLSGGMRQRVALARALLMERPFLILDEPFGSVDTACRKELHHLIHALCAQYNLTLMFITHDLDDAKALADRILRMDSGQLMGDA